MEQLIFDFVVALRRSGVRVSPPEAADALLAAAATGVVDRETLRVALRATLVKRELDGEVFERLFARHFDPYGAHAADDPPLNAGGLTPIPAEALDALGHELAELLDRILGSTDLELAVMVRQAGRDALAGLESLLQQGMVVRSIMETLGAARADAALDRFASALRAAGLGDDAVRAWRERLRDELERLRATVRGTVREQYERVDTLRREERRPDQTRRLTLGNVSSGETAELGRLVEQLGRRLDSLPELRRVRRRRGAIDIQRTWRASMDTGGIPFRLKWEKPPIHRPQVVALCDISNSMQSTVRFLLHFLYRLQGRFSRVRTFVFVSDVTEVTREFQDNAVEAALDRALQPAGFAYYSATNYGRALERFGAAYPDAIGTRTIVLVCGDARGNYTPSRPHLLEDMRRRARRVVWFNPESRLSWGLGDSAMLQYLPHVTHASEVRTLAQLESAIEAMAAREAGPPPQAPRGLASLTGGPLVH